MRNMNAKPISVLLVGTICGAIYGGLAGLCAPPAVFFLTAGSATTLGSEAADGWATLALLAPLVSGALGFFAGLFMASMFNLFVRQLKPRPAVVAIRSASHILYVERSDISGVATRAGQTSPVEGNILAG